MDILSDITMGNKTPQIMHFIAKYKTIHKMLDDPFYSSQHAMRIFTDGSCSRNGYVDAVGGFASIIVSGHNKNTLLFGKVNKAMLSTPITTSTSETDPTNNRAEGLAILTALNELNDNSDNDEWSEAIIYSDSMFWIDMIKKWIPSWNLSTLTTKKNPDIAISIRDAWNNINKVKTVSLEHVYSHGKKVNSDNLFSRYTATNNDLADELAKIARDLPNYDLHRVVIDDM
jgi:ribonuclease HI